LQFISAPERAAVALKPIRRRILAELKEPDSAAGLARRLDLPRQRLNYHLRELERQGFLECVEERRKGNCTERIVKATARAFVITPEALGALGESGDAGGDRFSAAYLARAAGRTLRDIADLSARATSERRRIATLTLETEIRFSSTASRAAFADDLSDAIARIVAKYHDDAAPAGRRFRLVTLVHPAVQDRVPSPDQA
ncbi:MAG TPA: helix-turn-helix domain-containing protein, partial [Vicinamibacterales bacterium]